VAGVVYDSRVRVLITGISGFVGLHLVAYLREAQPQAEIFGMHRWRSRGLEGSARAADVQLLEGDLLDAPSVERVLGAASPDVIFHLAASSSVASSWDTPAEMVQVNVLGTLHVLEAMRQLRAEATVVLACSAEAYGPVAAERLPIREDEPFRPLSPYAVSKAAGDMLGYQYFRSFGLKTVRLRLFNHCGPGQSSRFVVSSLARQVAEIEAGQRPPRIEVGDLGVRRDFIDVRDAVRAYALAAEKGSAGEVYNVASGEMRTIREVLDTLLRLTAARVEVVSDPARLRPADIHALQGDTTRFRSATGWSPTLTLEDSLRDTLEFWRREVGGRGESRG
jgi:GDP-4-dehydro-6-deoxy-D-mannose reductase